MGRISLIFTGAFLFAASFGFAQAGISASPAKLYYRLPQGSAGIQKVIVSNPLQKELEVGVSMGDWDYDTTGTNHLVDPGKLKISCADWIRVLPGSYFTLAPEEKKELSIELTVPEKADITVPVHTAMIYFSQLNPNQSKGGNGASIKVSVRMGIKIYHSFSLNDERGLEVLDFKDGAALKKESPGVLEIKLENTGKIWLDGLIKWELLNSQTGEKIKMEDTQFFSLPGDRTTLIKRLPDQLKKGKYSATAIINYGNKDELKVVELDFEL